MSILLLQAVADVAEQQVSEAFEAAQRDKEAAVTKSLQTVQRRASKEALHQVFAYSFIHRCSSVSNSVYIRCRICNTYISLGVGGVTNHMHN